MSGRETPRQVFEALLDYLADASDTGAGDEEDRAEWLARFAAAEDKGPNWIEGFEIGKGT